MIVEVKELIVATQIEEKPWVLEGSNEATDILDEEVMQVSGLLLRRCTHTRAPRDNRPVGKKSNVAPSRYRARP